MRFNVETLISMVRVNGCCVGTADAAAISSAAGSSSATLNPKPETYAQFSKGFRLSGVSEAPSWNGQEGS